MVSDTLFGDTATSFLEYWLKSSIPMWFKDSMLSEQCNNLMWLPLKLATVRTLIKFYLLFPKLSVHSKNDNTNELAVKIFIFILLSLLSKSESVKFLLIELVICLFTDSPVKKYISLLNQLIITEAISGIWLIYSNLFLAIWISQISLIISRFWLIHI